MNDSSNLTALELLKRFGPRRRDRFAPLRPHRDLILELRSLKASYLTVFQALSFKGVTTSEASVRQFCLSVLEEKAVSKGRKRQKMKGKATREATSSSTPDSDKAASHVAAPATTPQPPPANPGPRIAKVEFLEPPKL